MPNVVGESIFSNEICKYDFSCGLVAKNLKDRKLFPDQINRNHFDPILNRCESAMSSTALNKII